MDAIRKHAKTTVAFNLFIFETPGRAGCYSECDEQSRLRKLSRFRFGDISKAHAVARIERRFLPGGYVTDGAQKTRRVVPFFDPKNAKKCFKSESPRKYYRRYLGGLP